eukprot:Rhum_TRINITY_DN25366_c0_g1::Rhum_TRINITY_DN25366_c0_g1_i1::g.181914::m.181914
MNPLRVHALRALTRPRSVLVLRQSRSCAASGLDMQELKPGGPVRKEDAQAAGAERPAAEVPPLPLSQLQGTWGYETSMFTISEVSPGVFAYSEEYPEKDKNRAGATGMLVPWNPANEAMEEPHPSFAPHYYTKLDETEGQMWVRVQVDEQSGTVSLDSVFRPSPAEAYDLYRNVSTRVITDEFRKKRVTDEIKRRLDSRATNKDRYGENEMQKRVVFWSVMAVVNYGLFVILSEFPAATDDPVITEGSGGLYQVA